MQIVNEFEIITQNNSPFYIFITKFPPHVTDVTIEGSRATFKMKFYVCTIEHY